MKVEKTRVLTNILKTEPNLSSNPENCQSASSLLQKLPEMIHCQVESLFGLKASAEDQMSGWGVRGLGVQHIVVRAYAEQKWVTS